MLEQSTELCLLFVHSWYMWYDFEQYEVYYAHNSVKYREKWISGDIVKQESCSEHAARLHESCNADGGK
jgi:hypothetical protein